MAPRIASPASALLYLASWTIVLHVFLGAYVFIRYLKATSTLHHILDLPAVLFMSLATLSVNSTPQWCGWFAAVFTIAISKYLLCLKTDLPPVLREYTREKIRLESPSVFLFIVCALLARYLSDAVPPLLIEASILAASVLFAIYMIGIKRVYQKVAGSVA
ncbi:MAG: hypothetical protein PF795_05720 [Kiritimatiellae bacterium]|jgi:hypothetical protein|nr:hypothetical protein [Kiritimatiellia bacterium]